MLTASKRGRPGTPAHKVAIVTGAGGGIGRCSSLALGRAGFAVVAAGRRQSALDTTASAGQALGATVVPHLTDIVDEASVQALFARTLRNGTPWFKSTSPEPFCAPERPFGS